MFELLHIESIVIHNIGKRLKPDQILEIPEESPKRKLLNCSTWKVETYNVVRCLEEHCPQVKCLGEHCPQNKIFEQLNIKN